MKFIGFMLTAALLTSCIPNIGEDQQPSRSRLITKIGDPLEKRLVDAETITVKSIIPNTPYSSDFNIQESPSLTLNPCDTKRLKSLMIDDSGYFFERTKSCLFVPDFALVFSGKDFEETVFLSTGCKQLKVKGEDGKMITLDCDPIAEQIQNIID